MIPPRPMPPAEAGSSTFHLESVDDNADLFPEAGPSSVGPLSPSQSGSSTPKPTTKRPKTGCLTCRLRKKRCDEQKPLCATCERLGIDCLGYEKSNPDWLKGRDNKQRVKQDLKRRIKVNRATQIKKAKEEDPVDLEDDTGSRRPSSASEGASQPFDPRGGHMSAPRIIPYEYSSHRSTHVPAEPAYVVPPTLPPHAAPPSIEPLWTAPAPNQSIIYTQPLAEVPQAMDSAMVPTQTYHTPENDVEDVWNLIFGYQPPPFSLNAMSTPGFTMPLSFPPPSPTSDQSLISLFAPPISDPLRLLADHSNPTSSIDPNIHPTPDLTYLHHYLDVVLPLQYRFIIKSMGDVIAPLAFSNPDIYKAATALAALHRSANRAKDVPTLSWSADQRFEDGETVLANTMHRETVERLRTVIPEQFTEEGVVLPLLFAMSYYLFLGGTSRHWTELLNLSRRCLSAALAASPEISGMTIVNHAENGGQGGARSPWMRYRPLMCAMIWMDIVGSVTLNQASSILPVYRDLLGYSPSTYGEKRPKLHMHRVMGCDDTTFLAIAETVALSEWRDEQEEAECLSVKELLLRAGAIEQLMEERSWREGSSVDVPVNSQGDGEEISIAIVMSDIFFGAAKVLLASVIHGAHPRVSDISSAVEDTAEALRRLDILHPSSDVNRALILPITIAGSHSDEPHLQSFFRSRFAQLGKEAEAFGNSKQALQLLEEVWRRRREGEKGVKWRKVMRDLGWEEGILLI